MAGVHVDVERVDDLDAVPAAQRDGYDLLVHVRGVDVPARVEVKCDRHPTPNIYLETVSVDEERIPGCLFTSKADAWAYLRAAHNQIVWFPPRDVADWLRRQPHRFRTSTQATQRGHGRFHTRGAIVPLAELCAEVPTVTVTPVPQCPGPRRRAQGGRRHVARA